MLKISLHPSRTLIVVISAGHFLALTLVWPLALPLSIKLALCAVLTASYLFYLWQQRAQNSRVIQQLKLRSEGDAKLQTRGGEWVVGKILATSYVSPYLTILNIKLTTRRFATHLVLFPDAIDAEDYRKLRVWLKWKEKPGVKD